MIAILDVMCKLFKVQLCAIDEMDEEEGEPCSGEEGVEGEGEGGVVLS